MKKRKNLTAKTVCRRKDPNFYTCIVKLYYRGKLAGVSEIDIDKYGDELNQGVIWSLEVKEKFRKRGFSHRLIDESVKVAKQEDVAKLMLSAEPDPGMSQRDLVKLYEKHGFKSSKKKRRSRGVPLKQTMELALK